MAKTNTKQSTGHKRSRRMNNVAYLIGIFTMDDLILGFSIDWALGEDVEHYQVTNHLCLHLNKNYPYELKTPEYCSIYIHEYSYILAP